MDINNPVIQLCIEGTQAEFQGQVEKARSLYWQAWEMAGDDYEACIAAHYVARFQEIPQDQFAWNKLALDKAQALGDSRVQDFLPSLYLNMGKSYELLDNFSKARRYYAMAAQLGAIHQNEMTDLP